MGNKQSVGDPDDESVSAADKAQVEAAAQRSPLGARLYKHTLDKAKPWVLVGPAEPDFANDADNEEDDAPDWYFNVRWRTLCRVLFAQFVFGCTAQFPDGPPLRALMNLTVPRVATSKSNNVSC